MTGPTPLISVERGRLFPGIWALVAAFVFLLVYLSAFGESPDWANYDSFFDSLRIQGLASEDEDRIEIGFKIFSLGLIELSFSNVAAYGIIAATSAGLKCIAVNSSSASRPAFLTAMAFYLVSFGPLHELTQLRAALAIAFGFIAYACLLKGRVSWCVGFLTFGVLFHLSLISMLPLFLLACFFRSGAVTLTRGRAILLGGGIFFSATWLIAFLIAYFEDVFLVVAAYQQAGFGDQPSNPFSASILLNLAMAATGLWLWDKSTASMKYVLVFQMVGIGAFYATLDFQVVAHRFYELIQTFWVFYILDALVSTDPWVKLAGRLFVVLAFGAYSYIYVFSGNFFL